MISRSVKSYSKFYFLNENGWFEKTKKHIYKKHMEIFSRISVKFDGSVESDAEISKSKYYFLLPKKIEEISIESLFKLPQRGLTSWL